MADIESPDRRCVVITKESVFYVPEDNCPQDTSSTSLQNGEATPAGRDGASAGGFSLSWRALCSLGLCVVLLTLLALLLFYNRSSLAVNLLFAGMGVTLGYTLANIQSQIKLKDD